MNYFKSLLTALSATLLWLSICSGLATAQQITATISGTIVDPAGSVVAGATVTATSAETGLVKTATTNENGGYTITFLAPGVYKITVSQTGFTLVTRDNIKLEVAQTAELDISLGVASAQADVTVEGGETPMLQTETSQLETTVEQKLIQDLPSSERNIFSFVNLVPGTIDTNVALGNPNSAIGSSGNRNFFDSNFAVNGGRASTNDVLLDGITNTIGDFNGVTISPPQDAVREFKVVSGVAPAEYGRTGGGIVTISSKSGTRKYHGAIYEYFQDGNLNANGWQRNRLRQARINKLSKHQFGGAIGGPVHFFNFGENDGPMFRKLDKTFFFANYELRRQQDPITRTLTVPTVRMRSGDFGELLTGAVRTGVLNADNTPALFGQLYNPFGALVNGRRQPFAGNNLSALPRCPATGTRTAACLDPVALAVLQFLPLPTQSGLVNNFLFSGTTEFTRDIVAARIDHTISEWQNFFVRFSYEKRRTAPPNFFGSQATAISIVTDRFINTTFNHVYSLTPTLINNFRAGFTQAAARQGPNSFGFDISSLGFPAYLAAAAPVAVFPTFTIGGGAEGLTPAGEFTGGFIGGSGNKQARDTHNVSDSVTWIKGAHTFRGGAEYRLYKFYPFQFLTPAGSFSFNRFATRGPTPALAAGSPTESTGSSFASFLLGLPSGITQEVVQPITIFHNYGAGYVQDDWKIHRRLTLNLGLRWDFETGTESPQQQITGFDFDAPSPLQGRLNLTNLDPSVAAINPGIRNLTGRLSFPEGAQNETNFDRFAPRIGFAFSINSKTTLRGGMGTFFLPLSLEALTAVGVNFTNSQSQTGLDAAQVSANTIFLNDPFRITPPQGVVGNTRGEFTRLGDSVAGVVEPERPNPYNRMFNLVLQRELANNLVFDVAYVGSRGRNLPSRDVNLNQISSTALEYARTNFSQPNTCGAAACASVAAFLAFAVPNPFAGLQTAVPISTQITGATIPRAQLLRRFPQYTTVTWSRPLIGKSNYNALQVNLQKRFSKGWSALVNYTWSKLLDTGGVGNGASFTDPTNAEDVFNFDEEYSYSTLDVPHRVTSSVTYELPFGKGKWIGSNWRGLTNAVLGGWQVSGTGVWQRGAPLTITNATAFPGGGSVLTTIGNSQRRPNRLPGVQAAFDDLHDRVQQGLTIFNSAAFSSPSDSLFEFGNAARTYNDIRRDNYRNVDLSIIKNINFNEGKQKLQIRGEFLNAFNWVVFGTPGTQVGNITTFGIITTQGNRPRIVQLVGRFTF
ncbi:MAG TPA: carboxypeptidase regulatory-like domain-containing protein [Pyrinomonadaceae bacterium]|nr:carboxypeptidase regulatory-like domain-containing protein [Pyrinomonadaceae bacterium]